MCTSASGVFKKHMDLATLIYSIITMKWSIHAWLFIMKYFQPFRCIGLEKNTITNAAFEERRVANGSANSECLVV